jgi:hypothetical protein
VIIHYFKNKKVGIFLKTFILMFLVFSFAQISFAIETYEPGEAIVVGEFIYEDDYTPTTDDCTISIFSPAGATLVNEATMTDDATGWHSYAYTVPGVEGKYPTFITCGTLIGGDLLKLDKTFIAKNAEVSDASIASAVWASGSRSLTTFGTLVSDVWSNGTRTLSSFGALAADVWDGAFAPTRQLTTKNIAGGGSFATESYIDSSEATVVAEIQTTQGLINALNNISAADVWAHGTRSVNSGTVTVDSTSVDAIWDTASSGLSASGSIGKLIVDNLDAQVSTRGTSNLTAADVWNSATRTLSDYSTSSIATAVWANGARTLTTYGNDITAADVWNVLSSSLTTVGSIGEQLATNVDAQSSDILTQVQANEALILVLNDISAADVWAAGTRTLTGTVDISSTSVDAIWDTASSGLTASGSVGKLIADNLDAQVSTRGTSSLTAADVWNSATRTLSDYSTSTIATAVWANGTRTLSNYGNDITAEDVWNVLSSSLVTVGSIGEQLATNVDAQISTVGGADNWTVKMGNVERIQAGYTYRTKVFILDASATPTAPFAIPTVTLYDAERNIVVSGVATTLLSTGVYEYTYSVSNNAAQGLWETIVSTEVESGKTIQTNDYWEVSGSPAQVLINSVTATNLTSITGNVTITNEGLSGYEYQYEWCVVSDLSNDCGGNDDAYYALAAKFINPGEDWNTGLSATVSTAGTYYFKLKVYFGTDSSSASRVFTVASSGSTPSSGGGGGGGGSTTSNGSCNGADFNLSNRVDSVDFSILLFFWKTKSPFANPCVDINVDTKVDSVDFSILLYQWGTKPL